MASGLLGLVVFGTVYTAILFGNVEALQSNVQKTTYGIACTTPCSKAEETDYFWCKTNKEGESDVWDYCSPTPGFDYKGRKCSSPCDYNRKNYKWCNVAEGGWGYCTEDGTPTHNGKKIAAYGNACKSTCGQMEGTSYNWCRTETNYKRHDWDYCSAADGFDYKGRQCVSVCEHRDRKYTWCYVEDGWGYCSPSVRSALVSENRARVDPISVQPGVAASFINIATKRPSAPGGRQ